MNIALFFGSFNPIHNGHMVIAGYIAEFGGVDQVWLVVSPHNPLKPAGSLLQDHHRFRMAELAVGDYKKVKASKIEFGLPKPSYTIHTLAYLKEQFPEHSFSLLMGSDNLESFKKWKDWERIIAEHDIIIYPRPGSDGGELRSHPRVRLVEAPLMQLSSTFIRHAIRDKKDIRYMMPKDVWEYVDEMNFYRK